MKLPALWERADVGLEHYDGIVWFRETITLPQRVEGKSLRLDVGKIDDSDQTWFNGLQVGSIEQQYQRPRSYHVPGQLVRAGENVITVRVVDTGGGGGIWGSRQLLSLETPDGSFSLSLAGDWKFKTALRTNGKTKGRLNPNDRTSLLFNGMLKPVMPYAIKGAIWYQGESNAWRAYQYRSVFPAMIKDWRLQWGQGDFPFLFVQLANFKAPKDEPGDSDWAELREAQSMALSVAKTGMAVIIDIGEADDIHPRNKQDVGKRLALAAKKVAYGMDVVHSGPMYDSMEIAGDKIRIRFTSTGSGLMVKDNYGYIKGFAVAGKDKKFIWANAILDGNEVVVWSPVVQNPVAVRYAWADNPDDANLYNKEGLPASPFRTDQWPGVTVSAK
jgi:sialate O-acetylesterase